MRVDINFIIVFLFYFRLPAEAELHLVSVIFYFRRRMDDYFLPPKWREGGFQFILLEAELFVIGEVLKCAPAAGPEMSAKRISHIIKLITKATKFEQKGQRQRRGEYSLFQKTGVRR